MKERPILFGGPMAECRIRCQTVLTWYGLQDGARISLSRILAREPYYLLELFAMDKNCALCEDVRIASRSVDGMVLAMDAVLRAQLWPAREDET